MGGCGSTRWGCHFRATTVEETRRFATRDIATAIRSGEPYSGILAWSARGQSMGTITYLLADDELTLDYVITDANGKRYPFVYTVQLIKEPRYFGGYQVYFQCPTCERRVSQLCQSRGVFQCRQCGKLTYSSSQESRKLTGTLAVIARISKAQREVERLLSRRSKRRKYRELSDDSWMYFKQFISHN